MLISRIPRISTIPLREATRQDHQPVLPQSARFNTFLETCYPHVVLILFCLLHVQCHRLTCVKCTICQPFVAPSIPSAQLLDVVNVEWKQKPEQLAGVLFPLIALIVLHF